MIVSVVGSAGIVAAATDADAFLGRKTRRVVVNVVNDVGGRRVISMSVRVAHQITGAELRVHFQRHFVLFLFCLLFLIFFFFY